MMMKAMLFVNQDRLTKHYRLRGGGIARVAGVSLGGVPRQAGLLEFRMKVQGVAFCTLYLVSYNSCLPQAGTRHFMQLPGLFGV